MVGYVSTSSSCGALCPRREADPRLREAPALVRDRKLIGLTEGQLDETLGPSSDGKTFVGWDQAYYLGPDSACVDSIWLVIRFDGEGRVSDAKITND